MHMFYDINFVLIVVTSKCVVCGFKGPASLPLVEPLPIEIANYFVPLSETLGSLRTATSLQNTQLSIILERFYEIVRNIFFLLNL